MAEGTENALSAELDTVDNSTKRQISLGSNKVIKRIFYAGTVRSNDITETNHKPGSVIDVIDYLNDRSN